MESLQRYSMDGTNWARPDTPCLPAKDLQASTPEKVVVRSTVVYCAWQSAYGHLQRVHAANVTGWRIQIGDPSSAEFLS